jgi:hypothetical protein
LHRQSTSKKVEKRTKMTPFSSRVWCLRTKNGALCSSTILLSWISLCCGSVNKSILNFSKNMLMFASRSYRATSSKMTRSATASSISFRPFSSQIFVNLCRRLSKQCLPTWSTRETLLTTWCNSLRRPRGQSCKSYARRH